MLQRMPLVSVVLPVHNAAATVARAVASIQAQTLRDWELLAVEDGSTDASREILLRLAASDPRVRVLQLPRSGLVRALNAGLDAARAPLIARMDADDVAHPERLAEQFKFLGSNSGTGVVSCRVDFGGEAQASAGYALHVDWLNSLVTPEDIALNRFIESPLAHPSVMFRRALVDEFGGYRDGDFPEDYELWLRWMEAGVRVAKVPRVLLTWHDLPQRLSRTDPRYDPEAFFKMKAEYVAREVGRVGSRAPRRIKDNPPCPQVLVWGAGRPTRKRAAHLEKHGVSIAGYIDVDEKKIGRKVGERPVLAPGGLPPPGETFVLGYVASRGARELVRAELNRHGYREGRDFLMCA
jgi:glycosyltransferase involved in cell wall biosynthesis